MSVSIIVPVYNVENYLHLCIQSVINQSFSDWELLLIDDGSTDASGKICDYFSQVDARIKTIHKQNTGVSDTRNLGLDLVCGKYVIFLDADDYWIDYSFLETFVRLAEEKNLDIIRGEYNAVDTIGSELYRNVINAKKRKSENIVLNSTDFIDSIIQREFFLPLCLIKHDVIKKLRFNSKRVFLEDLEFFIHLLLQPLQCYYTSVRFYAYRKHSLSASNNYNKKRLADAFDISRLYLELSLSICDEKLAKSFKARGWDYYWLTLRTIAIEKSLFTNSKSFCNELSLAKLKHDFSEIIRDINCRYKWLVVLSPYMTICYFRLRYMISKVFK